MFQIYSALKLHPSLRKVTFTTYKEWRSEFADWAGQKGTIVWDTISKGAVGMEYESHHLSHLNWLFMLTDSSEIYRDLSKRLWACLSEAIKPAFGTTLVDTIEAEQKTLGGGDDPPIQHFKFGNVNELWTRVSNTLENKSNFAALPVLREIINLSHDRKTENPVQYGQRVQALYHRYNTITK